MASDEPRASGNIMPSPGERFGWTINHLLECEDTLAHFRAEAANFERERDEARRQLDELLKAISSGLDPREDY